MVFIKDFSNGFITFFSLFISKILVLCVNVLAFTYFYVQYFFFRSILVLSILPVFGAPYLFFSKIFLNWTSSFFHQFFLGFYEGYVVSSLHYVFHYTLILISFLSISFFISPLSNESLLWVTAACAFYYVYLYIGPTISTYLSAEVEQTKVLIDRKFKLIKDVSLLQTVLFNEQNHSYDFYESLLVSLTLSKTVPFTTITSAEYISAIFADIIEDQVRIMTNLRATDEFFGTLVDLENETNELLIELIDKFNSAN